MKKLIALMFLLCSVLSVFATDYETESNVAYLKGCNLQVGTDGTIDLYLKSERPIGTVHVIMDMPEGVTINSVVSNGAAVTFNEKENNLLLGKGEPYYSTGKIATLNVTVAADAQLGYQTMTIKEQTIVEPDLTTYILDNVNSELTIQKTAIIEPLDANNDIEIIPFEFTGGGNFDEPINAAILMKSESYVKSLEFDFELPAGISVPSNEEDGDVIYAEPELENNKGAVSAEITMNEDGTYHYSLSGTSTKYIYAADEMTQFSTLPLMSENPVADGVYTIKIYNISMTTKNDKFEGGNYYASVIVGQPAQEEAILYGHFTSDAASTFTTALKNVAIADVTAATVDEGVKFTDVLVNEKGGNSYYTRTSANYGTTVLPLNLMVEGPNLQLYTVMDMTSESIIIEEKDDVPANTPCIFKGTINAEGATPTLGVLSEQGLGQTTFKGTYEATSIAAGEGYYIASDGKFYGDGASIRPFRGYFDGAVVGAKSFTVILDTPTGLVDITNQFSKEDIYNLQGMRLNDIQKGVNIKGGKKIYVK